MKCKRIAALSLSAFLTVSILPSAPVMADEAVAISTVSEFKEFTEKCVYDEYSKNKTFVLQNDIDLRGEEIECAEIFCGIFEGGGHSITNVSLSFEGSNKGLFATVTKDGEIHDLNVTGDIKVTDKGDDSTESILRRRAAELLSKANIESDNIDDSANAAGGIVGHNSGRIVNCSYGGKIAGKRRVGGIVGTNTMTGIIDSCANGSTVSGEKEAGGIAGYNEGRVKLCVNNGKICPEADEKTTNIGGICGNSEGALVICTNEGEVGGESFGDNVGGISGKQSGEIRECINYGAVLGRRSVGGICGRFEPYTDIELSYESAKAAIDKQIDTFNEDINEAREKIIKYFDELLDGRGILSEILDRLGIKEGSTSSRLDRLTNSAVDMMDSVKKTSDALSGNDIAGSVKDALDSLGGFSDEASQSVKEMTGSVKEISDSLKQTSDSLDSTLLEVDEFLNEFDGKGQEITDTLDNLNDAIDKGEDDIDELRDKLFDEIDSYNVDLDDLDSRLTSLHNNLLSTMRQLRGAGGEVSEFFYDMDDSLTNIQREVQSIKDRNDRIKKNVNDRIANIRSRLHPATPTPSPAVTPAAELNSYEVDEDVSLDSGYDVEPSVAKAVKDMLFTVAYAEEEKKMAISDLKSTDITLPRLIGDENADTALIKYCVNDAEVKGHELIGGISGSVGFESTLRSGDSITLPDGTKIDADSILKSVTESCINNGDIYSKSDYAGGITGKCDIGDIKNSLSTGEIEIEEGSYAGGIAGFSSGDIRSCIAINDIEGDSYIGGIAGQGRDIETSYSLARLDGTKDKSGAVAGFINGSVEGTYFIDEGLSGVNGTNLEGKAEAVAPSEIAASDGKIPAKMPLLDNGDYYMAANDLYMPQINTLANNDAEEIGALLQSKSAHLALFHFDVLFIDKGKELKTMTVDYGTLLDSDDIPRLTADGTEVPAWDKDVHAPIVRHTKFTAEYNKATMTISSGEEPPLLLVESVFEDSTEVALHSEEVSREFAGYTNGEAYSFTLTKRSYDYIKVHIRDENKKAAKVAVEENGKWTVLDCEVDGSYAVFTVGAPCKFVILYNGMTQPVIILVIAGVILLAAAGAMGFVMIRRRHGREKKKDI